MYKNINSIILCSDKNVDQISSIAAKYDLVCLYKIGVYGNFKQHELEIIGPNRRYKKFIKDVKEMKEPQNTEN